MKTYQLDSYPCSLAGVTGRVLVLKIGGHIDAMEVLLHDSLVRLKRLRGKLTGAGGMRFVDFDTVHEQRALVLRSKTLQYRNDVFGLVSAHELR